MVDFDPERPGVVFGLDIHEIEFVKFGLERQLGFIEDIPDELDVTDPRQETYTILQNETKRLVHESAQDRAPKIRGIAWLPQRLGCVVVEAVEPAMVKVRMEFAELRGAYPTPNRYQKWYIDYYNPSYWQTLANGITTKLARPVA